MWRSIAAYGFITTLNRAVVFLATLLLTRTYSSEEIGTYVLCYTLAQLVLPLASLGGATVVIRESSEDPVVGLDMLRIYVGVLLIASVIALTAALGLVSVAEWIRFGVIIGCLDGLQQIATSYFQGRERVGSAIALVLAKTVLFLGIITWAVLGGWSLEHMLWAQVAQGVVVGMIPAIVIAGRQLGSRPLERMSRYRPAIRYGLLVIPHTFALWLLSNADRMLLGAFASKAAVGIYVLSFTIAQCVLLMSSGFAAVFTVNVVRRPEHWLAPGNLERLLIQAGGVSAGVLALACSAAMFEMKFIQFIRWGDSDTFFFAGLIASGLVLSLGCLTFGGLILRHRLTAITSKLTILAAAISAPCVLLLIVSFGIAGAAASALVGYGMMAALYFRSAQKLSPELAGRGPKFLVIGIAVCALHVAIGVAFQSFDGWVAIDRPEAVEMSH